MKKLMSIMLVLSLFFGFATNAFAEDKSEVSLTKEELFEQGLQIVEEANVEIDAKIAVAVAEAEVLKETYFDEIRKIEQSEIDKLTSEKEKLEEAVGSGKYSKSDVNEMNRKIAELEDRILFIPQKMETDLAAITKEIELFMAKVGPEVTPTNEQLYKAVEELKSDLSKKAKKYVSPTENYVKKLDEVITDCYDVTLAISNEAIGRAKAKGVDAECSWKLVRFGHLWVWIDPIRIIGRY